MYAGSMYIDQMVGVFSHDQGAVLLRMMVRKLTGNTPRERTILVVRKHVSHI